LSKRFEAGEPVDAVAVGRDASCHMFFLGAFGVVFLTWPSPERCAVPIKNIRCAAMNFDSDGPIYSSISIEDSRAVGARGLRTR
jgi:hypothetical protein